MDKKFDKMSVSNGVTYVAGLGFISPNNNRQTLDGINKLSNVISISLIIYFFCQNIFTMPATYLASMLGFDININQYTGLIITSTSSSVMIKFIACVLSLAICSSIVYFFSMRSFHMRQIFRKPTHGSFVISIPIILSVGLLGSFVNSLFSQGMRFFGIVLSENFTYSLEKTVADTIVKISLAIIFVALEEIAFHGIILFSLRKYGDGFAIISSSIVYALFQNGVLEIISSFMLGIAIGYFVVRSGSIYIAVAGRCSLVALYYLFSHIKISLPAHISTSIVYLICIIILCISLLSFSIFARRDDNAFVLRSSEDTISLRSKLAKFGTSLFFLLLASMIILQNVNKVQIIG